MGQAISTPEKIKKVGRPLQSSPEWPKLSELPTVDRIIALPDYVLNHVLSFLPIEDAFKTQVLSRRWLHIWTHATSFEFLHGSCSSKKTISDFARFVDKTLVLCTSSKLKKLGVQFPYEPEYASNVNLWTRFAIGRGVEELQLDLANMDAGGCYLLPQLLYTNSSFKALHFRMCRVIPKGVVCWNSLKKLTIGYMKLNEVVIQKILAGSPVLDILELYTCYGFNRLHVSSASVKKLILRDVGDDNYVYDDSDDDDDGDYDEDVLEISAPHLHSLEISGSLGYDVCRLGDVSSLIDANIGFHMNNEYYTDYNYTSLNMLRGLLQSLVHVKNITLGNWAIQVIGIMEEEGLCPPRLKCECLTLDTGIRKSVLLE